MSKGAQREKDQKMAQNLPPAPSTWGNRDLPGTARYKNAHKKSNQ